jgi:hypothetical protein
MKFLRLAGAKFGFETPAYKQQIVIGELLGARAHRVYRPQEISV